MALDLVGEKTVQFVLDPDHMRESLGADGLIRDNKQFLLQAYAGLGPLLSGPRCSPDVLLAVDAITNASIWLSIEYGAPTGALLIVPLNAAGADAAESGTFNALDPSPSHLCRPGGAMRGIYGWLFAGVTPVARRRVLRGAKKICEGEFGAVPVFARAATPAGASTLKKLGFVLRGSATDQYVKRAG